MNINRICAIIAAAALTGLSVFAAEPVFASYVALGDSIAYGYGLQAAETECYTNIIAAEAGISAVNYTNYAVNGMTSSGLLNALNNISPGSEAYTRLKDASLITVSIGSNDLLSKLSGVLRTLPDGADAASLAAIEATLTSEQKLAEFDAGVESYRTNLPLIYAQLRTFNPSSQIIMTGFYNPYHGLILGAFDFGALSDEYITRMNDILHDGRADMDYAIAAIYDAINAPGMTNVNPETSNADPHPNAPGHAAIARAVLAVLDYAALAAGTADGAGDTEGTTAAAGQEQTEQTGQPDVTHQEETPAAGNNAYTGRIILTGLAVAVFAVTGIIITRQNKRTG
ncbi:MAG: GDSL-type esterase/lipase family protein [Eubacteriales bacterium]|nr:GDSL-type esterase/lipase family protein [Eubacteriales bacterium]